MGLNARSYRLVVVKSFELFRQNFCAVIGAPFPGWLGTTEISEWSSRQACQHITIHILQIYRLHTTHYTLHTTDYTLQTTDYSLHPHTLQYWTSNLHTTPISTIVLDSRNRATCLHFWVTYFVQERPTPFYKVHPFLNLQL